MEAIAKLNNVPTSPRKMRLIADLIRGKEVDMALNILKFDSKVGSKKMEKLLLLLVVMAFAAVLILFIYLITRVSEIEQRAIHGEPADTVSTQPPGSRRE